jgi:hypothetical protein
MGFLKYNFIVVMDSMIMNERLPDISAAAAIPK